MCQKDTAGPMKWDQAMSYASSLSLGGHSGWWLPNEGELLGLYNSPCKDMVDLRINWYWSSTTDAYDTSYAWRVNFYNGDVLDYDKSNSYYVRAVRGAQ